MRLVVETNASEDWRVFDLYRTKERPDIICPIRWCKCYGFSTLQHFDL